jgi:hypothetical protein
MPQTFVTRILALDGTSYIVSLPDSLMADLDDAYALSRETNREASFSGLLRMRPLRLASTLGYPLNLRTPKLMEPGGLVNTLVTVTVGVGGVARISEYVRENLDDPIRFTRTFLTRVRV